MESTDSSAGGGRGGSHHPNLPPGFRFHPTDEELVVHYLKRKASSSSSPLQVSIIAEVDLYKYDPWDLPVMASFGEHEWYFFTPRDRKYPNGARPNRAAISGYWKATGTDKAVMTSNGTQKAGVKKALVFYKGKPPKGVKTSWIMHEYRIVDNKTSSSRAPGMDLVTRKNLLRLDDWVLCRIYKKNNTNKGMDQGSPYMVMDEMMLSSVPPSLNVMSSKLGLSNKTSSTFNTTFMVDNEHASYELGLTGGTASNASSMSQLASPSLNSYSFKCTPLPRQHLYCLNGEQDLATMLNGPSSCSSKGILHHVIQGDSNLSALVSLHNEAKQVVASQTASLDKFNVMGVDDYRQPYQLAAGLNNWYPAA